jgi:hypothetical protein
MRALPNASSVNTTGPRAGPMPGEEARAAGAPEYMSIVQLAAWTPWSEDAIRRMVTRGVLRKGVHYFQPFGSRSQLVFKWWAIVNLIESPPEPVTRVVAGPRRGELGEVAAATAALERLLG